MNSHGQDRIVGFDRKIRLEWLDATARWTAEGRTPTETRALLGELLDGSVVGGKAKANTVSVLVHIWVQVPDTLVPLRDEGLRLIDGRRKHQRFPIHWGMCAATYPFFRSVASATGRLVAVQGTASLSQITRRVTQRWGERTTVIRAVQRVVRSLVLWEVLKERTERGVFAPATKLRIAGSDPVGAWLLEAMLDSRQSPQPLHVLRNDPTLFPFTLDVSAKEVATRPRMEVHRQGLDEDWVTRVPTRQLRR